MLPFKRRLMFVYYVHYIWVGIYISDRTSIAIAAEETEKRVSIIHSHHTHIQQYIYPCPVLYYIICLCCEYSARDRLFVRESTRKKKSVTHAGNQKHVQIYTEGASYTLYKYNMRCVYISALSSRIYRRCVADKNFS